MSRRRETFECPHCGADVVVGKSVCRECGSDAGTGWQSQEEIDYQGVSIPDGYGPDDGLPADASATPRWVAVVALVLVAAMVVWIIWR